MRSGTIYFAGVDLGAYGRIGFTQTRRPFPPPPAMLQGYQTDISVSIGMSDRADATVWAKVRALQNVLEEFPEGELAIENELGIRTTWRARPNGDNLAEAIAVGTGKLQLEFVSESTSTAQDVAVASFVPDHGTETLTVSNVTGWAENIRTERKSGLHKNRSLTESTVNLSGRAFTADLTADYATRLQALTAYKDRMQKAADSGRLTFGDFDERVVVETLTLTTDPTARYLEAQLQANYSKLPGDSRAECDYTVRVNEDCEAAEISTSISGSILAEDRATALLKRDAIVDLWKTAARRVAKSEVSHRYLDGETPNTWTRLDFSVDLREAHSNEPFWTLDISTTEAPEGNRITYSGTVYADSLAAAAAKANAIAGGQYSIEISSEITTSQVADCPTQTAFQVGIRFRYEYLTGGSILRGRAELVTSDRIGAPSESTLSIDLSADSYANALAAAVALKPAGVIFSENSVTQPDAYSDANSDTLATVKATYRWASARASGGAIRFTNQLTADYGTMTGRRTISGTVAAPDAVTANSYIDLIVTGYGLATSDSRTEQFDDSDGLSSVFLAMQFNITFEEVLGGVGHDIISASVTLERVGSVDHAPVTPVPCADPVKQTGFGYTPGRLTVSGSVRARQQVTARTWGQARRALAETWNGETGAEQPPQERIKDTKLNFDGSTSLFFEFSFTYAFVFSTELKNLWPAGLTL